MKRWAFLPVLAFCPLWLAGCVWGRAELATPPPAPCPVETLLLDEASFPSGDWEQLGSPSPRGAPSTVGVERLGTSFSAKQREVAVNHVYRFFEEGDAERGFYDLSETWFRDRPYETTWLVPEQIAIKPAADEFRLACNYDKELEVHQCRFIGQYGVYVTELSMRTIASSEDEFAMAVANVDARLNACLASDP